MTTIKISFPNDQNSNVFAYQDDIQIFKMEREFLLGSKNNGRIFEDQELLVEASDFFLNLKILSQNLNPPLIIKSHNIIFSNFEIGVEKMKIIQYQFWHLLDKSKYAKIVWDSEEIARIGIDKNLDFGGINLTMTFNIKEKHKIKYSILGFLLTQLTTNI
ncbi:hypothetical protein ACI6PS_00580 [Flavobacterium sp. PLA-1-15]|uniref:hypothetical protein n=1 Tax=Flavobacterium sp. PLA-1-15 TaxID=3380533 RepID=UPI003B764A7A